MDVSQRVPAVCCICVSDMEQNAVKSASGGLEVSLLAPELLASAAHCPHFTPTSALCTCGAVEAPWEGAATLGVSKKQGLALCHSALSSESPLGETAQQGTSSSLHVPTQGLGRVQGVLRASQALHHYGCESLTLSGRMSRMPVERSQSLTSGPHELTTLP